MNSTDIDKDPNNCVNLLKQVRAAIVACPNKSTSYQQVVAAEARIDFHMCARDVCIKWFVTISVKLIKDAR